jgi:NTP pyrophosphatase (non-canonical NTP hydrolase)
MMDFDTYQRLAHEFADHPDIGEVKGVYPVIGLAGEVGEFCEKFKKVFRDGDGSLRDEEVLRAFEKELGDVLWYLAELCSDLDLSLNKVAQGNLEKLSGRRERNLIHGSGDDR